MLSRRALLSTAAALPFAPSLRSDAVRALIDAEAVSGGRTAAAVATDEDYWAEIRRAFDLDDTLINLNNGGVCPAPSHVLEAMIRDLRFSNELPVRHMWQVLEPRIESVRRELAADFGCEPDELAITRNASEAMETLILGLDLRRGDEVIVTDQNYPRMLTTWDQRARRDGIVVRRISFDVPPRDTSDITASFADAIGPRTRAIELPHITNLTGQIMPIREIVKLARAREIPVLVDGAHAFAHFPFTRADLDCDYYGTSLHKWLLAPIGTGFLYVRRDRIPHLWPMMAAPAAMDADIRKYEEIGTHPAANHNAIAVALAFHRAIGVERKAERLRWLRRRWTSALTSSSDRITTATPDDPAQSCAIGLLSIDGTDPNELVGRLWSEHRIVTTPIHHPQFSGLRITPNVYTQPWEVDRFVEVVTKMVLG